MKTTQENEKQQQQDIDMTLVDENYMGYTKLPSLDNYLTKGLSIFDVVSAYSSDLWEYGKKHHNEIDMYHASFLDRYLDIIMDDQFVEDIQIDLQKKFMDEIYRSKDEFSFAMRGRIKSLIRLENKFNDYVQSFINDNIIKNGKIPTQRDVVKHLERFRDIVAYRFILEAKNHDEEMAKRKLFDIANTIPRYFDSASFDLSAKGGYTLIRAPKLLQTNTDNKSALAPKVRAYYKDYVSNPKEFGFQALVIVMKHNKSGEQFELQMETFEMLKHNEHSEESHHTAYEKTQTSRRLDTCLPEGYTSKEFNEAHARIVKMRNLSLSTINVDMFFAFDDHDVEDLCGLLHGRQANPREFL